MLKILAGFCRFCKENTSFGEKICRKCCRYCKENHLLATRDTFSVSQKTQIPNQSNKLQSLLMHAQRKRILRLYRKIGVVPLNSHAQLAPPSPSAITTIAFFTNIAKATDVCLSLFSRHSSIPASQIHPFNAIVFCCFPACFLALFSSQMDAFRPRGCHKWIIEVTRGEKRLSTNTSTELDPVLKITRIELAFFVHSLVEPPCEISKNTLRKP